MQMLSLPHLVQAPSNDLEQARKEILYNSLNIKREYSYYFWFYYHYIMQLASDFKNMKSKYYIS